MVAGPCNHEHTTQKATAFAVPTTTGKLGFFLVLSRLRGPWPLDFRFFRFALFDFGIA
jgi:hypothetical protein